MDQLPAAQIGQVVAALYDAAAFDLPNPLVYANFSTQCDPAVRRSLLSRNLPRRAQMDGVNLLRYPAGTLVEGDRSYLAVAGDAIIAEQIAPWRADAGSDAMHMRAQAARALDIDLPCVLLARYGENTWGHWVAEMLVKAAVAERFFPGQFFYAVPWWTTEPTGTRGIADAVLESLAAYGISPDRLVRLGALQMFRFSALHDVSGAWQEGPHPGALESLRALDVPKTRGRRRGRLALLRRPPDARAVFNADEVQRVLKTLDFTAVDLNTQTFSAQVRLFRDAAFLVGSLGSNFTGALYAGTGTNVISLAPAGWEDGYFIRLFQHLGLRHADLRGPSIAPDGTAPHRIDTDELAAAMAALQQPECDDSVSVDGEILPRRLGAQVLSVSFQAGGVARFTNDWSGAEPTHRWSLGAASGLEIGRANLPPGVGLWLEIAGQGHVYPPRMPTRPLTIRVNGWQAGNFDVIGRGRYFCRLTAEMLGGGDAVSLTFEHPICPSPRMMGAGADHRPLGFGFERLVFYRLAD